MDDEEVRASSPLASLALTSRGVLFLLPGGSERVESIYPAMDRMRIKQYYS